MLGRPSVQFVTLDLPLPISTNDIWTPVRRAKGAGMVKSKRYLAWLSEAGWMLNSQRPGTIDGPYALTITIPNACPLDADNCVKATSDLLQKHQVISNDRLAQQVTVKRGNVDGMKVMVVSTQAREAIQ